MALMSKVSEHTDGESLKEALNILFNDGKLIAYNSECKLINFLNQTKVTLNGKWIGFTEDS